MILAHNKSVLKYLHDAIEHRNIASVGYYVGGMKESALKETESKEVVIATYAMAEEALDIKTLSCLIMATPKTDVTQAVGRILRVKHKQPLVIDIVDQHDIFQRQSIKRLRFYKKCNYKDCNCRQNNYRFIFQAPLQRFFVMVFQLTRYPFVFLISFEVFFIGEHHFCEQRSECHGHNKRCKQRNDKCNSQRFQHPAFHSRKEKEGQKSDDNNHGGIKNGSAYFFRCLKNHGKR